MSRTIRLTVLAVALTCARAAWPCSGEVCSEDVKLATLDGGVPLNFQPLVLTGTLSAMAPVQLRSSSGAVVAQARSAGGMALFIDTAPLIEGERYQLVRQGGCNFGGVGDAGTFVEDFTVTASVQPTTQWATLGLADAGVGAVNQYSGASCFEPVRAAFAVFQISVQPAGVPLLPFFAWDLEVAPLDGGPSVLWQTETVGGVLADGGLGRVANSNLAPKRITTVWHACPTSGGSGAPIDFGLPTGRYRAQLHARFLDTDAGFTSQSGEFELSCPDAGEFVIPGVDAGPAALPDAGMTDAGPNATPSGPGLGCTSVGGELLIATLAVLLRGKRRSH